MSCRTAHELPLPPRPPQAVSGNAFYRQVDSMKWNTREPIALKEILSGNVPAFLRKLVPVHTSITGANGKTITATYYVTPDYLSIGGNDDFARIPLTPMTAQLIADSLQCFLPTRKMVNDIYLAAKVKPEPVPLYAFRDSAIIFWHHHMIIEGQRKGEKGLIAGIKKDVVISSKVSRDPRPERVAIYGWHKPDGKPIQPLYTGHVNWYVDYSHGIRLVYRKIKVDKQWMDYTEVLRHPVYKTLLCDEDECDYFRYGQ
ncbi:hypothetical protein EG028_22940 [Chitinophaga barathri]|uniref:Uncharacterized protein n=2 Tax=Chitinophaga barathri TaxID=1647451 RepID=A0A3N4MC23_9BACT|nr:hypothetical protein EG028_22940 [Chitinophaga barathri]